MNGHIAPSYQQNYTIISEPFKEGKKSYVMIKHNRTQNERRARWYPTDEEYYKAFPKERGAFYAEDGTKQYQVKSCLGFSTNGAITIFNEPFAYDRTNEFLKKSVARFHKLWGWYIIGEYEVPAELPADMKTYQLRWEMVGGDNEILYSDTKVKNALKMLRTQEE